MSDDAADRVLRQLAESPAAQSVASAVERAGVIPRRHLPLVGRLEPLAQSKYTLTELPVVDCVDRLPICGGRCCRFPFYLSAEDVEDGVQFDTAKPYRIAHGDDGRCVHNRDGQCTIYDKRPAICRTYSCRHDARIWVDFERRIPVGDATVTAPRRA